MKKQMITLQEAMQEAFLRGMQFDFSLEDLIRRVAPQLVGKTEKEITRIWRREVNATFKKFFGEVKGGFNAEKSRKAG